MNLIHDSYNGRLELHQEYPQKQLLDMPLNHETMILDLGSQSVLVKYRDTTRRFEWTDLPNITSRDEHGNISIHGFNSFSAFIGWLREIRNNFS